VKVIPREERLEETGPRDLGGPNTQKGRDHPVRTLKDLKEEGPPLG